MEANPDVDPVQPTQTAQNQAPIPPQQDPPQNTNPSTETSTLIAVLLLLFVYPIGLIYMWIAAKWPKWVKFLITLPFILSILGIVLAIFLITLNPASRVEEMRTHIAVTATPTPVDETANWKTYTNKEENWQITYPQDQNIKISEYEKEQIGKDGIGKVIVFSKLGPTQSVGTEVYDGYSVTIGLKQKNSLETVLEFAKRDSKPDPEIATQTSLKDITINGHKGVETTVSGLGQARLIYLEYPVIKDRVYYIAISATGPGDSQVKYEKIVGDVLQSFKSYR